MSKKIWITGASSGIGKALAIKFSKEGWQVAASARREKILEELSNNNSNIFSFPLDVVDQKNSLNTFNKILEKFNNIDLCVFSTGFYDPKTEKEINLEQIKNTMNVNFFGTLNCIKAVEKYFKEKKNGHISIVSSVAGYRGLPAAAGYCSSKSALISLAETLYFDFKRCNVRVSLINPGFITDTFSISSSPFLINSDKVVAKSIGDFLFAFDNIGLGVAAYRSQIALSALFLGMVYVLT